MSECYPTGCTPCNEPIDFPDMPADGDRHCVPIGSNGEQKCWVYDKCIPGWRAEGPNTSTVRYRGVINVCQPKPADFNEQAGDWLIASAACNQADVSWGLGLGEISIGDRLAFNGTTWDSFPPPEVPYAEEARDGDKPDPDDRMGGIVKNATTGQAIAGTDKCDTITPYTLQAKLDNDLVDFTPTKPDPDGGVTASIVEDSPITVCAGNALSLTCDATAVTTEDKPALGRFTFAWKEIVNGNPVPLITQYAETATGSDSRQLVIEDFNNEGGTSYNNATRTFRCDVTFTDLFSETTEVSTETVEASSTPRLTITSQPVTQTIPAVDDARNFTVAVESTPGLTPIVPTYKWFINDVEITATNVPANTGYEYNAINASTLTVTLKDENAPAAFIKCEISGSACDPQLMTEQAMVQGPNSDDPPVLPPSTDLYGIGSYTTKVYSAGVDGWFATDGTYGPSAMSPGKVIYYDGRYGPGQPPGQWRVMGVIFDRDTFGYPGNRVPTNILMVRVK